VTTVKITVINFINIFYIEYCKNTFLNPDFVNFERSLTDILTLVTIVT